MTTDTIGLASILIKSFPMGKLRSKLRAKTMKIRVFLKKKAFIIRKISKRVSNSQMLSLISLVENRISMMTSNNQNSTSKLKKSSKAKILPKKRIDFSGNFDFLIGID